MASGMLVEFDATLVFVNRKGVTVEVVKAKWHDCSSKLFLSFGTNEPRSLKQRQLGKNHNFGTATSY